MITRNRLQDGYQSFLSFARRGEVVSVVSGALFAIGWWLVIDACIVYTKNDFNKAYLAIGILGSLSHIGVNLVSNSRINGEIYSQGCCGTVASRLWLFLSFLLLFGCVIGAAWIMMAEYIMPKKEPIAPGIALFMQLVLIFVSSLLMKFGRSESNWT